MNVKYVQKCQKLVNLCKRYERVQIYKLKKSIVKGVTDGHIDQRLVNVFCKGPGSKSVNILSLRGTQSCHSSSMCSTATVAQTQKTGNSINEWARRAPVRLCSQKADLHLLTRDPDGKDWSCIDNFWLLSNGNVRYLYYSFTYYELFHSKV